MSVHNLLSSFRPTSSLYLPPPPFAVCFVCVLLRTSQSGGPGRPVEGATSWTNHTRRGCSSKVERLRYADMRAASLASRVWATLGAASFRDPPRKSVTRDISPPIDFQGPQHVTRFSAPSRGVFSRLRRHPPPSPVPLLSPLLLFHFTIILSLLPSLGFSRGTNGQHVVCLGIR